MKVEDAEYKLNNLLTQNKIALCSQKDIDGYISYIDIMWNFEAIPEEDKYGGVKSYRVIDKGNFE